MSFCKNCGKELHGQEQCNCQRQVSFSPKKRVLSVVAIVIAALVVCIIALFTLFLSGYKKPINNLFKGIQNCDKDKFCSAFTDEEIYYFSDKFDEFDKDFNGFIDDKFNEILEANYGEKCRFKVEFVTKLEADWKDIRYYKEKFDIEIKKLYKVKCELQITGSKDKGVEKGWIYVAYVTGEGWKIVEFDDFNFLHMLCLYDLMYGEEETQGNNEDSIIKDENIEESSQPSTENESNNSIEESSKTEENNQSNTEIDYYELYSEVVGDCFIEYNDSSLEYYLFDIDNDSINELIIQEGTSLADAQCCVYTEDNGKAYFCGTIEVANSGELSYDENQLYYNKTLQGYQSIYKISKSKNSITSELLFQNEVVQDYSSYGTPLEGCSVSEYWLLKGEEKSPDTNNSSQIIQPENNKHYLADELNKTVAEIKQLYSSYPKCTWNEGSVMYFEGCDRSYGTFSGLFNDYDTIKMIHTSENEEVLPNLKKGMTFDEISEYYELSFPNTENIEGVYMSFGSVVYNDIICSFSIYFPDYPSNPVAESIGIKCEDSNYFTGKVNTESTGLRLRSEPSTDSEILLEIPKDSQIKIYEPVGEWYYVEYNNTFGYVLSDYVIF